MIVKAEVSASCRNWEPRLGRAGRSRFRRVDDRLWGWGLAMKPRLNKTQLNSPGGALGRSRRLRAYPPRLGDSKPRAPAPLLRSAQRSARLGPALPGTGARPPCALVAPRTEGPHGLFCSLRGTALPRLSPARKPVHSHDSSPHRRCCTTLSRQRGDSGHGAPGRWRGRPRGSGRHRPADHCELLP